MVQQLKKNRERFFAESVASLLHKSWDLGADREGPDFLVTEGKQQFRLEVCEVFTGPKSQDGSTTKKTESKTARAIDALRREYEAITNIPLRVKLVGDACAEILALVVPALVAGNFASKPIAHQVVITLNTGLRAGLRVYVTKALRPDWFSVNDRVGWVDHDPMPRITAAVMEKSKKLPQYQQAAGWDVRLLVVADRINNSGKLTLKERAHLNLQGFRTVYFFSYPENVRIFGQVTSSLLHAMHKTVNVTITVEPETAAALADVRSRKAVGRPFSCVLSPASDPPLLARATAEMKAARAGRQRGGYRHRTCRLKTEAREPRRRV